MIAVAKTAFICVLSIGGLVCLVRPTTVLGWYERALSPKERLSVEFRQFRASRAYTLNVQIVGVIALLMGAGMIWATLLGARP